MEILKEQEKQKLEKQIKQIEQLSQLESEILSNSIEFKIDATDNKYRVRMPTIREKQEINKQRLLTMHKLQRDGFLYEAELIEELREKQGVDITILNKEIINIEQEIKELQLKLVPEIQQEHRDRIKRLITELNNDFIYKMSQKVHYLETSIEAQITEIMITHFAACIFEKQNGDKWEKVFKNYEEFIDSTDINLTTSAINYTYKLLF